MFDVIEQALESIELEQCDHPELGVHERVLAYELYHRLRSMESNGECDIRPSRFQAELDKRAQEYFGDGEASPDLLVHEPGSNDNNLLVVELKRVTRGRVEAERDLRKLAKFVRNPLAYRYRCLVLCCENRQEFERAADWICEWRDRGDVEIGVIRFDVVGGETSSESIRWEETPMGR